MRDLNEPPAAPHRGEKTCRSCWNVLASLRAHDLSLTDLNSDLMLDDPQHSAAFFCSVAALRGEVGGPLAFDKVKHLLIKQVTLVVRASHQHLLKKPWRPMTYWVQRGYTEEEVLKAPQKPCGRSRSPPTTPRSPTQTCQVWHDRSPFAPNPFGELLREEGERAGREDGSKNHGRF